MTNYAESKASIVLKLVDSNDIPNAKIEVKKIKDDLAEPRQRLRRSDKKWSYKNQIYRDISKSIL